MILSKLYSSLSKEQQEELFSGLAFGLLSGLVFGLAFGIASPLWLFAIAIIIVGEVLFALGREKPSKEDNKWLFTLRYKAEALFESALIVVNFANAVYLFRTYDVPAIVAGYLPVIEQGLLYIGAAVIICAGVALWIWLNSLKYEEGKRKVGKPRKIA